MRIAYVTAHYPPDFVSGATLQVERLALGAVALGHEVEVFSGAISIGLADGEVRVDAADSDRAGVRWIGTVTRIEQGDDGNWDNPFAATAVTEWLDEFRPDVIHLHTLQTLGVGVVEAAVASGIRTVVTMHDLWWWCARLFLVDTDLRPCPLVTDVGTCACARTATWRADRAARLGRALAGVDEILAPSAVLRDVIIANGVHPDRVTVDENDIAEMTTPVSVSDVAPPPGTPVRFLYIGGDSPLKGAQVLRDAVDRLRDVGSWQLDAYGLSAWKAQPPQCRIHAPFDAPDLSDVLTAGDVLIIPSIARESFSIAAREALAAGLAVITSDCLGPEEVVIDRANGLVTATGDPAALAAAMRSIVADRGLLAGLRSLNSRSDVRFRTPGGHVESLIERYGSEIVPDDLHHRRVAFVVGVDGAAARSRVHRPHEALALSGDVAPVVHSLDPDLESAVGDADVVVLQQAPATRRILEAIRAWRATGKLVVFDAGDEVPDPDPSADEQLSATAELAGSRKRTLAESDGAIAATTSVADRIRSTTGLETVVVPSGLGLVDLRLAERARALPRRRRSRGRVRLAYVTPSNGSHAEHLAFLDGPLGRVMDSQTNVDLIIVGDAAASALEAQFPGRVERLTAPPWRELVTLLAGVDVNLVPVDLGSSSDAADGGDTWLYAAAVGVPTIASPSSSLRSVIEHERTGMLCSTPAEWEAAVMTLVTDNARRSRLGTAARRRVELHHGPHSTAHRYRDAFGEIASSDTRRTPRPAMGAADSTDVDVPDGTASVPVLETYDDIVDPGARGIRGWLRDRLTR